MQFYTVYLHLETALHVLGGTSTHHQERVQPTAIVEELEFQVPAPPR